MMSEASPVSLYLVFLWSLLLTITIEGLVIFVIFRCKQYVYYSLLCNLLTNPALNLMLGIFVWIFGERAYLPTLVIVELAVIFVEAAVYRYICGFGMRKSVMLSACLNFLSLSTGVLINRVVFK